MSQYQGNLRKLIGVHKNPVEYHLPVGEEEIPMNEFLGKNIQLEFTGKIHCIYCSKETKKSYGQGFCYKHFNTLARCDFCVLRPETCHYFKGTCREPEWGEANCMIPHFVYLSLTSDLKVGITRHTQVPTRFIDQGASEALPIFKVQNRLQSGLIENFFKEFLKDMTHWKKMLKGECPSIDLIEKRDELFDSTEMEIEDINEEQGGDAITYLQDEEVIHIHYPIIEVPETIKALNFDKGPLVKGKLMGIKGQYLMLDSGVLNVRKFTGYEVKCKLP